MKTTISSIAELSASIRAHISSAIAGGENRLCLPSSSENRNYKFFFKKGTAARERHMSDAIVKKSFLTASAKPSGWLKIFCLEMGDFLQNSDRGLSQLNRELTTLDQLTTVSSSDLENVGLKGGAVQLLSQLAASMSRANSVTPSPVKSPFKPLVPPQAPSMSFTNNMLTFSESADQLDDLLDTFFLAASKIHKVSGKPRLESENAYSKLRAHVLQGFEEFLNFHRSSRRKRSRSPKNVSPSVQKS